VADDLTDPIDAYSLLSKPTLELTDAEVLIVVEDLRKRREAYIKTGKPDKPKAARVASKKLDKDEKARNTALLLAQLKLPGAE
jgi:hypothetical protein